jgi:hypothetical protein
MDDSDLHSYRMLLAESDDFKDSAPEAVRVAQVQ